jgi:hypothetical protein
MSPAFVPLVLHPGLVLELDAVRVHGLGDEPLVLVDGRTYWVMASHAGCVATLQHQRFELDAAQYMVVAEPGVLRGGRGMVIEQLDYRGVRQLGGPLERCGRLRYVDGCSDTLLVCPPRLGEACLNHLHIPAHIRQSTHHHPSLRLGIIARGRGACRSGPGETSLEPGLGWYIPAGLPHGFSTQEAALDVFAWHPDSDFGPTDDDHPMINRTLLR